MTPSLLPDYPFNSHFFQHTNGLHQHFIDEGQGNPVLMLHGNPSWSYYYRHLILALRSTHRCIAPDHIGMGLSDKPLVKDYNYNLQQRVNDLDALMQHLGNPENLTLVLHDWGGMIGMAYACRYPHRISRVIILNTAAFPNPKNQSLPTTLRMARNSRLGDFLILYLNAFARGAARWGVTRPMPRSVRKAYLSPYNSPQHRIATLKFVQDIPLSSKDHSFELVRDIGEKLSQFAQIPSLICWGMRDFVFDNVFLQKWKEKLPYADVHEFANAGHYILEDAHKEIIPLVKIFLNR